MSARLEDARLKPCPFCGGSAWLAEPDDELWYAWTVWCSNDPACGAESGGFDTREQAIAAWNKRYQDGAVQQDVYGYA